MAEYSSWEMAMAEYSSWEMAMADYSSWEMEWLNTVHGKWNG